MQKVKMKKHKKLWYDYLWIVTILYYILALFNILFAWLGLIAFILPLAISILGGGKAYCNKYCGRSQLFEILGRKIKKNGGRECPKLLKSKWFRYSFLIWFMTMFAVMIYNTYLVFGGADLSQTIKLLWTFRIPFHFAYTVEVTPWLAKFAFGFYGMMLTSTILGLITMVLFKPRTWCVYCPMGTMTQGICKLKEGANIEFRKIKKIVEEV